MHRSGTSWLGAMLAAGDDFINIGEPLNASNRQTILPRRVSSWYLHITAGNEADFLPYYKDAVAFRAHPIHDVKRMRLGSPRDPIRMARRWGSFALGRLQRRRLLIKDPFAVLSIDWFIRRLGCQVVVTVRHPVAVVSSLKRLRFSFDFDNLLRQPSLMNGKLRHFRSAIEASLRSPDDIIGQGSLLWRIIYESLAELDPETSPAMKVVRHEDLSLNPLPHCEALYNWLGLDLSAKARGAIEASTSETNPREVSARKPFKVRLASQANLGNWQRRLDEAEIERILEITEPVVARYYPEGLAAVVPPSDAPS
jgi:hypothetical protein